MTQRRGAMYAGVRYGMLAVAAVSVVFSGARTFPQLGGDDVVALCVALAFFVMLLRINVPTLSTVYGKRKRMQPGRLTLELPVTLAVFTIYGPAAAAAMQLCGYPLAIPSDGRSRFMRRLLDGGADAFAWTFLGLLRMYLLPQAPSLTGASFFEFLAFYTIALIGLIAFVWMPLKTLTQPVSLLRLWRSLARDTHLLMYLLLVVSWGYVCTMIWTRGGMALGLCAFAPLPFIAGTMRAIHDQRLDMHRLRLARDAVQAMLRTNDPLPQMNSLLASLHAPSSEETLQIYAAISPEDRLSPLATLGPLPDAEQQEGARRVIADLAHGDRAWSVQRLQRSAVTGYAVRAPDDALLGAIVVHRSARTSSLTQTRRFSQAASELAPLLRDFQAIAATQNAARVDPLTGLPNRRTIMEMMHERIESVSVGNPCAVLLLDIDHFKSVNDLLGHQAGDNVLRRVGSIIAHNIRSLDRAGRIGGEEFVVLMPDTSSEMACTVGERLRSAIEGSELRHADGEPITASIGVAVAAISDTVDSLLARADRALYQAKRQGRNRVIEIGA
jgi:diguanylate cyclase (GGDEF)-like protein